MLVISTSTIQKLGLMHLVVGLESYKTTLQIIMQAMGRVENLLVKVGEIKCFTTFMVVDMHSYNVLMGLNFLVKIKGHNGCEKGFDSSHKWYMFGHTSFTSKHHQRDKSCGK